MGSSENNMIPCPFYAEWLNTELSSLQKQRGVICLRQYRNRSPTLRLLSISLLFITFSYLCSMPTAMPCSSHHSFFGTLLRLYAFSSSVLSCTVYFLRFCFDVLSMLMPSLKGIIPFTDMIYYVFSN
jgi:hypothetical protein